jgi:predicted secreted protein
MGDVVIMNPADGHVCSMAASDRLIVMLPVNPSTGFRWAAEARGDLISAGMSERTPGGPDGRSFRGFVFRALRTGTADIAFKLWRPWEGSASTIQRIGITVTITPQQ